MISDLIWIDPYMEEDDKLKAALLAQRAAWRASAMRS